MNKVNKLVEDNIGLVWYVIKNNFNGGDYIAKICGCTVDDLFQEGCIGLIEAAKNFDESKGIKFSTYACKKIKVKIMSIYTRGKDIVNFSRSAKELAFKIKKYLKENNLNSIDKETIIKEFNVSDYIAEQTIDFMNRQIISADLNISNNGEKEVKLIDYITKEDDFSNKILQDIEFQERLNLLDERSKNVLLLLLQNKSQREVARILGISQVHVYRIKDKAIKTIQNKYKCS